MQKYFGIIHNDLHLGNIMISKNNTKRTDFICYTINNKDYYIPSKFIIKIIDFGRGRISKFIEPDVYFNDIPASSNPVFGIPQRYADVRRVAISFLNNILEKQYISLSTLKNKHNIQPGLWYETETFTPFKNEEDFNKYTTSLIDRHRHLYPDFDNIFNILQMMLNGENLLTIIQTCFKSYVHISPSFKVSDVFSLDIPLKDMYIENIKLLNYINPINFENNKDNYVYDNSFNKFSTIKKRLNNATIKLKDSKTKSLNELYF